MSYNDLIFMVVSGAFIVLLVIVYWRELFYDAKPGCFNNKPDERDQYAMYEHECGECQHVDECESV